MLHKLAADRSRLLIFILVITLGGLYSCSDPKRGKKTIVYINSYHREFPPSDRITKGVTENLPDDKYELVSFFMDTKRNPSESSIRQRALALLDSIKTIKTDLIIVSDDNAMKYIIEPHFQGNPIPIVFCGINWSVQQYDLSGCNITGTLEILPVVDLIQTLRPYYPGMNKILVLNENTTTSRKTQPILDTLLGNLGLEVSQKLVDDFESWKVAFSHANDTYDIIYLQTKGAIQGWEDEEAIAHIKQLIKIPVVTCEEFMMPFAVFGLTQLSEEQGTKAAEMAKMIINGTDPSAIPINRNTLSEAWLNPALAKIIGFQYDEALLEGINKIQ